MRLHQLFESAAAEAKARYDAAYADYQKVLAASDSSKDGEMLSDYWRTRVVPLRKAFEAAFAEEQRLAKAAKIGELALPPGYTPEVLYHGSSEVFDALDRRLVRTAAHIYTTPDRKIAETYGNHLYEVYGRQEPQADLTVETSDGELVARIHEAGNFQDQFDLTADDLAELIFDGRMYQDYGSSGLQDAVIDTCIELGCRSVRFTDPIPSGGFGDSVVFHDNADVIIKRKLT